MILLSFDLLTPSWLVNNLRLFTRLCRSCDLHGLPNWLSGLSNPSAGDWVGLVMLIGPTVHTGKAGGGDHRPFFIPG